MEDENNGIVFKEILRIIISQKWLALAIAVLITLVGTVALQYGYNPSQKEYITRFSLILPGNNNGSVHRYPDGNIFYYTDIIGLKTLQKIKNAADDGSFADIDVEYMADNGKISIDREFVSVGDSENSTSEAIYTLRVKASFFNGKEQAKKFIMSLANTPVLDIASMNIDYDVYLSLSESAIDYDKEINYLKSQMELLENYYSNLVNTYGGSFVVNGKILNSHAERVRAYLKSGTLDNLLSEARQKKYLKSEELKEVYNLELDTLRQEYEVAKAALDALLNVSNDASSGSSTIMVDSNVIREQAELVAKLDQQIKVLETYMSEGTVNTEFAQEIKTAYDKVSEFTKDYSEVSKGVYVAATSVKFEDANIVIEQGGYSFILLIILSLIVGVLVACVVSYFVGKAWLKRRAAIEAKKEKPTENPTE